VFLPKKLEEGTAASGKEFLSLVPKGKAHGGECRVSGDEYLTGLELNLYRPHGRLNS
jgi:hypothetical protein